jgi:hypothetical protein
MLLDFSRLVMTVIRLNAETKSKVRMTPSSKKWARWWTSVHELLVQDAVYLAALEGIFQTELPCPRWPHNILYERSSLLL